MASCNNGKKTNDTESGSGMTYTCPMPKDSVFSDEPGKCPKCGMELIMTETMSAEYSCPMHPEVTSKEPGKCPKCGMDLVKKEANSTVHDDIVLDGLLKPTNEFAISAIPVTSVQSAKKEMRVNALGTIEYDNRQSGNISARISGRVEKLYVRYKYQKIAKGEKIMDVYSPELMDAQQNLLLLLKNDEHNSQLINDAKQKLLLLGMSDKQLNTVIANGKPDFTVSVFSSYSGHIHEAGAIAAQMENTSVSNTMSGGVSTTGELNLKEGMYIKKGQLIFVVDNPDKSLVLLNIFSEDVSKVKEGQLVDITPETMPSKKFTEKVSFIEPFFRPGNKTLTARIYFDNSKMQLPVGSQVTASIESSGISGYWLPKDAVISLGLTRVVFKKVDKGFVANKVVTGSEVDGFIEILDGLSISDMVAQNAQYLMDSESFIRINNN